MSNEIERPQSKQPIPEDAEMVFKGDLFEVYRWEEDSFDGGKLVFEKVKRPDTVVVFPVLVDGRVMIARQEQPGKEPFRSAFGGRVDREENVLGAAKRELLEESGYEAERFILWSAMHPVSKVDWVVYTFVAKGAKKVKEPYFDGGEKIEMELLGFNDLIDVALSDDFSEKAAQYKILEAKAFPEKMAELERLFDPRA